MAPDPASPPREHATREPGRTYRRYRARPQLLSRGPATLNELRTGGRGGAQPPAGGAGAPAPGRPAGRRRRPLTARRVLKWIALALVAWVGLSLVLFVISAQFLQSRVDQRTKAELASAGLPIVSPSTVLILGSDQRPKGSKEPGATTSGPSRSDSIQLLRVGGGHSAKLSIPRDTVVNIPGYGLNKINAAYAIGGSALAVKTIKQYLGIGIDHVILVNFAKFPQLVDAMGGVTYTGGCVVSRINGGFRNGGYTLRLHAGSTHIDGKQALALARTRHNLCNPRENDLTRASRQQKIVSAMRSRVLSPAGFIRWPWIAWRAPQTVSTDMGAAGLTGLAATIATAGNAPTRILRPTGAVTLPDGGAGLTVSPAARQRAVRAFLSG
ncbi:MAG TPA: LCP family protein [Solirubrobacteraceae bacterium]|nr:LCP family protein [Solirubrobacteraceae bacterium]